MPPFGLRINACLICRAERCRGFPPLYGFFSFYKRFTAVGEGLFSIVSACRG